MSVPTQTPSQLGKNIKMFVLFQDVQYFGVQEKLCATAIGPLGSIA